MTFVERHVEVALFFGLSFCLACKFSFVWGWFLGDGLWFWWVLYLANRCIRELAWGDCFVFVRDFHLVVIGFGLR